MPDSLPSEVAEGLRALGFEPGSATALTGGVASDIWRVETPGGAVCVKRARARLKVAEHWEAPVERNAQEVAWLEVANRILPGAAPRVLGHDPGRGLFVMAYYDLKSHPLWKGELMAGRADPRIAAAVGERLAGIHGGTAGDGELARRFANDSIFQAIRLEPYLAATGRAHPPLASRLAALAERTLAEKRTLMHGDISPKNILLGPDGPIFLDAECASFGDPAFDLAFCLNHLLLKCLWRPTAVPRFLLCYRSLAEHYLAGVTWEAPQSFELRAASLLPALLLARLDGKSPVEYLTRDEQKNLVRRFAPPLILAPLERLTEISARWQEALS